MTEPSFAAAYAPVVAELAELIPHAGAIVDAHTHLGRDEDGRSLDLERLLALLDRLGGPAKACVFPFNDPDRHPAYRIPNDRVLAWARESGGRLLPFCRLNPADEAVLEARRCLAAGARGIKLHPRAQSFGFGDRVAVEIFGVARDAGVPVLVHAGRGMPSMSALAELALGFPEVPLVLAHGAIADQGMFASRLAEHPAVLYDTSCSSALDVVELFARVPAERIVFGSDVPYGLPAHGLWLTLRAAALAGLDDAQRALVAGGTMTAVLDGTQLPAVASPRLAQVRPASGRLARIFGYLLIALEAGVSGDGRKGSARGLEGIRLARAVCCDPDPGTVGPALERIEAMLSAAEQLMELGGNGPVRALALVHAAGTIAATEPVASGSGH